MFNKTSENKDKNKLNYNLKYISNRIIKENEDEWNKLINMNESDLLPQVPCAIDDRMTSLAKSLDKKREKDLRRKKIINNSKRCAIFFICFCIIVITVTTPGEAWKYKINSIFKQDQENYIELLPYDFDELNDWNDYYIFSKVPEKYNLVYAENKDYKIIVFSNEKDKLTITQMPSNTTVNVDNETVNNKDVLVNGIRAHYFNDSKNLHSFIIWLKGDFLLEIESYGESRIRGDELIKLAEELKFIHK